MILKDTRVNLIDVTYSYKMNVIHFNLNFILLRFLSNIYLINQHKHNLNFVHLHMIIFNRDLFNVRRI